MRQRFGIWEGRVVDNNDPESRNRIKIRIASVHGTDPSEPHSSSDEDLPWARLVVDPVGLGQGELKTPQIGSEVLVAFIGGHADAPVVIGSWLTTLDLRNASEEDYIAGDQTVIVEGDSSVHSAGTRRVSASRDVDTTAEGVVSVTARRFVREIAGQMLSSVGPVISHVRGDYTKQIAGITSVSLLKSAAVAVVGKLKLAVAESVDVFAAEGIEVKTYLNNIKIDVLGGSGSARMRLLDALGVATLAEVVVQLGSAKLESVLSRVETYASGIVVASGTLIKLGDDTAIDPVALATANEANWTAVDVWAQQVQVILAGIGVSVPTPWTTHTPTAATKVVGI